MITVLSGSALANLIFKKACPQTALASLQFNPTYRNNFLMEWRKPNLVKFEDSELDLLSLMLVLLGGSVYLLLSLLSTSEQTEKM